MNTKIKLDRNEIDTMAERFAEETRGWYTHKKAVEFFSEWVDIEIFDVNTNSPEFALFERFAAEECDIVTTVQKRIDGDDDDRAYEASKGRKYEQSR